MLSVAEVEATKERSPVEEPFPSGVLSAVTEMKRLPVMEGLRRRVLLMSMMRTEEDVLSPLVRGRAAVVLVGKGVVLFRATGVVLFPASVRVVLENVGVTIGRSY